MNSEIIAYQKLHRTQSGDQIKLIYFERFFSNILFFSNLISGLLMGQITVFADWFYVTDFNLH